MATTTRVEIDPGARGRVLDALMAAANGCLAGTGALIWTFLMLGISLEALSRPWFAVIDQAVRTLLIALPLMGLAWICIDTLRYMHYARVLGAAPPVPTIVPYQAKLARPEHPFFAVKILAGILIAVGVIAAFAAITFLADNDGAVSVLIALAAALVGIGGGYYAFAWARKARDPYAALAAGIRVGARREAQQGAQLLPQERPWYTRPGIERLLYTAAFLPSVIGGALLLGWAIKSGQVMYINGRAQVLPDSLRSDLSPEELLVGERLAGFLAGAALWGIALSLMILVYGMVQYSLAHRDLRVPGAQYPAACPRGEVSELALAPAAIPRRATFSCAAVAIGALALGTAMMRTGIGGTGPLLIGLGLGIFAASVVVDVLAEPRSREQRNEILRNWPTAEVQRHPTRLGS